MVVNNAKRWQRCRVSDALVEYVYVVPLAGAVTGEFTPHVIAKREHDYEYVVRSVNRAAHLKRFRTLGKTKAFIEGLEGRGDLRGNR
jgi:hypothetical protein